MPAMPLLTRISCCAGIRRRQHASSRCGSVDTACPCAFLCCKRLFPRSIAYTLWNAAAALPLQALNRQGWKAVAVHGDASQAQRTAAVDSFKVTNVAHQVAAESPLLVSERGSCWCAALEAASGMKRMLALQEQNAQSLT
jgi:hypothetical protein